MATDRTPKHASTGIDHPSRVGIDGVVADDAAGYKYEPINLQLAAEQYGRLLREAHTEQRGVDGLERELRAAKERTEIARWRVSNAQQVLEVSALEGSAPRGE